MMPSPVRPVKLRRALGAAFAACLVAVLAACPGEINGRVDRIGGPVSGGGSGGGTGGGGPISGGGGGTDSLTSSHDPFVSLAAGDGHTCGLTARGLAYCWGFNIDGQLGTGDFTNRRVPTQVLSATVFREISASGHVTCAVSETGAAYCWGHGYWGALGVGDTINHNQPTRVIGSQTWLTVSAGEDHSCGVDGNATAWCWGNNWPSGQLGDSTTTRSLVPVQVRTPFSFAEVHPGSNYTCGRRTDGVVMCWGGGTLGGDIPPQRTPQQAIATNETFVQLDVSTYSACALESATPRVECWGQRGIVGFESAFEALTPARITLNEDISDLSIQQYSGCVLNTLGRAFCWGTNLDGQLAGATTASSSNIPLAIPTNLRFIEIAVGAAHVCAIANGETGTGGTYCWGRRGVGATGDGEGTTSTPDVFYAPVRVK